MSFLTDNPIVNYFKGKQGATAPMLPYEKTKQTPDGVAVPMSDPEEINSAAGGRRKRRTRRRGGFVLQNPNLKTGAPPTGAAGTLGGRRTRKHKGKGKKHTRRH
jgi:hypothetical protein